MGKDLEDIFYRDLADATILRAVDDYKKAIRKEWALRKKLAEVEKEKNECLEFFNGEYIEHLMEVDIFESEKFIRQLDRQAKKDNKIEEFYVSLRPRLKK